MLRNQNRQLTMYQSDIQISDYTIVNYERYSQRNFRENTARHGRQIVNPAAVGTRGHEIGDRLPVRISPAVWHQSSKTTTASIASNSYDDKLTFYVTTYRLFGPVIATDPAKVAL